MSDTSQETPEPLVTEPTEPTPVETTAVMRSEDAGVSRYPVSVQNEIAEMKLVQAWGRLMDASGFFPDTKTAAQAAVKILAGRELGFTAMQSMTGFHIIDGKVVASAHIMAHAVKRSGKYDYRVTEQTNTACRITFYEKSTDGERIEIGVSEFTMDDADRAGLTGSRPKWEWRNGQRTKVGEEPGNYARFPRNMLFSRAMSNGIAWYCPDVFDTRVYTADELRPDIELTADGDVAQIDAIVVEPPRREQQEGGRDRGQRGGNRGGQQPPRQSRDQRSADREPDPPRAREQTQQRTARKPAEEMTLDDVVDLQSLQSWQWARFKRPSAEVCRVLDVESTAAIAQKYTTPEQYRTAAEELFAAFDPDAYTAALITDAETQEAARAEYEAAGDAPDAEPKGARDAE